MTLDTAPTIGRIVHYVMPANGKHRPAVVVEVYGDSRHGQVNLLVFKDGINDGSIHQLVEWTTAINFNQEYKVIGTWHWPEGSREDLPSLLTEAVGKPEPLTFSIAAPASTTAPPASVQVEEATQQVIAQHMETRRPTKR